MSHTLLPAPSRTARIAGRPAGPVLTATAALGLCVTVSVVDPNEPGSLGLCPFKLVTGGLDCPGCGLLRATRALTRGDVLRALDHNLVVVLLAPVLLWMLVGWLRHELGRRPTRPAMPSWATPALAVGLPVWWVVRNLPWFGWLGSAAA